MGIKEDSLNFAKFLINIANFIRANEPIHFVSSYELARIIFDFETGSLEVEELLFWFSPYKEDWEKILTKFPADYIAGMVKGFKNKK